MAPRSFTIGGHELDQSCGAARPRIKKAKLIPPRDEAEFVPVPERVGEALVFNNFLIHRSGRNRRDTVRFSMQVRFSDLDSPESRSEISVLPRCCMRTTPYTIHMRNTCASPNEGEVAWRT